MLVAPNTRARTISTPTLQFAVVSPERVSDLLVTAPDTAALTLHCSQGETVSLAWAVWTVEHGYCAY